MPKFLKDSCIKIPRSYEDEDFYQNIKEFLTRTAKRYGYSDIVTNYFYVEGKDYLMIPRLFPVQNYVNCEIKDKSHEGEDIDIKHKIKPRNDLQKEVMNHLKNTDNATVELEPGTGKTVITIHDIATRKKRSLIIVHTSGLTKQWKQEFLNHTDISEKDILMISSANYKQMKDHKILITTNQTILSLLRNKRADFLNELYAANIGIFIGDEAHTSVGAATFSECSIHVPAKVTRALSATPYRFDGNGDIIEYHMGKIFQSESLDGTMHNVRVNVVLADFGIDQPRRSKYIYWAGSFQRARYLNLMSKETNCPRFHKILRSLINKFTSKENDRDIILMAERTKLIDKIYKETEIQSKGKFYKSNSLDNLTHQLVLATPNKMRDGIDAPWKDCLIMTSPISNIKQMVGRVCRTHKNKSSTIIVDMVDIGCYEIAKTFFTRYNFYKKRGWKINFLYVDLDMKVKEIDNKEAVKLISSKRTGSIGE